MFSPKTISVPRIVEYSTISMLDYFEDNLANVVLPEAWLECDSNDVTRIENNCVKHESIEPKKTWVKYSQKLLVEYNQETWV